MSFDQAAAPLLSAIVALAVLSGIGLAYARIQVRAWRTKLRVLHRVAALTAFSISLAKGVTLLWSGILIMAALGYGSRRLRDADWALVLLFVHATGGALLLIAAALS